jgi:hypothetical protein
MTDEAFAKILAQLKTCPTCDKDLERKPGTSILQCPDRFHGQFAIIWSREMRRYIVSYNFKARAA